MQHKAFGKERMLIKKEEAANKEKMVQVAIIVP